MGEIRFEHHGAWARVTLANPGKLNAIDIAMWRELRALFERLQALPAVDAPHAVVVCGADGRPRADEGDGALRVGRSTRGQRER